MTKNNFQIALIVLLSIGCGASGAMLAQEQTAHAQTQSSGYGECFQIESQDWSHAGNADHLQEPEGRFPIPSGWTPVGGGPNVLWLCR